MAQVKQIAGSRMQLQAGRQWHPDGGGWLVLHVWGGSAYWRTPAATLELGASNALVAHYRAGCHLLASQLGDVDFSVFGFRHEDLPGLFSVGEIRSLESLSRRNGWTYAAGHPVSVATARALECNGERLALNRRCDVLSAFSLAIEEVLALAPDADAATTSADARRRLQLWLSQNAESRLVDCTIHELAEVTSCSPRHMSRLFHEEVGVPFRERQKMLRMNRARSLLRNPDLKIVEIAMESGYRNLGLFNTLFRRSFGMTPSEWRSKQAPAVSQRRRTVARLALAGVSMAAFCLFGAPVHAAGPTAAATNGPVSTATATNTPPAKAASGTNAPAAELLFRVVEYDVRGNTLLPESAVKEAVGTFVGERVGFETIRQALASLQLAYRGRGWATVSISLPQQKLTNGIVQVQVVEGRISEVVVTGNKWFSTANVLATVPSAKTNEFLNSKIFQAELDQANADRDRQIYPQIQPGADPGTTVLVLRVKDQIPLHGRFELNNQRTPSTPEIRGAASAQYNNLWQAGHSVGLQYGFAMQQFKEGSDVDWYDRPAIASYSIYYRLPIGGGEKVSETIRSNPTRFGFDEGSRQFRLPPASGRTELNIFASKFTTDTGVQVTPDRQLNPPPIELLSHESGQDLTAIEDIGLRLSRPFKPVAGMRPTFTLGVDLKHFTLSSFNTNNFLQRFTYTDPISNTQITREIPFASGQPPRHSDVTFLPLMARLDVQRPDKHGFTSAGVGAGGAVAGGPFTGNADFRNAAGSARADGTYYTLQASASREQRIFEEWTLLFRADGQWASQPLLSIEQFGIGGLAGVRGYLEGERFGDAGWRLTAEQRMPMLDVGMVDGTYPMKLTPSIFMDYGQSYFINRTTPGAVPEPGLVGNTQNLWGTGIGFNGTVGSFLDFRLAAAWPLQRTAQSIPGRLQIYFGIAAQF
jgi:hemolysin activation/secretion protein/AraC-like DNA-binding protein